MPKSPQLTRSTAAAGRLKQGTPGHPLTDEERRKGGLVKAAKARALQEEARRLMVEELAAKMSKATGAVDEALEADASIATRDGDVITLPDHRTRLAAADRVFDRVAGKPIQGVEHSGPEGQPIVVEHRDKLSLRDALAKVTDRRDVSSSTRMVEPNAVSQAQRSGQEAEDPA